MQIYIYNTLFYALKEEGFIAVTLRRILKAMFYRQCSQSRALKAVFVRALKTAFYLKKTVFEEQYSCSPQAVF